MQFGVKALINNERLTIIKDHYNHHQSCESCMKRKVYLCTCIKNHCLQSLLNIFISKLQNYIIL